MNQSRSPTSGVGAKVIIGVLWMVLLKLTIHAMALINLTVLARLLTPADFGVVAMAMFFYALLESIAWFGFDSALIQNQQAGRDHYNSAFTLNLIFYSLVAVALFLIAGPVAAYYREPRVEDILQVLAVGAFVVGLENIGTVDFRKHLDFRKDYLFMISKKVAAFLVTIPLAFYWRNYWALIAGMMAGRVVGMLMSYVLSSYRPRFSLVKVAELFNYSKWLFVNTLAFTLRTRAAEPIVGRISGPSALGLFNVGYEISNLPTTELVAPINRAVFPGYAKLSHDLASMRAGYLAVIGMIALIAIPASAGIAAIAPVLIPVWLGDKWADTLPLIRVLALSGVLTALMTNSASVFLAMNKPRTLAMFSAGYIVVLLLIIYPLTQQQGPIGAAWAYVIASIIVNPLQYAALFKLLQLPLRRFLIVLIRPLLAATIMFFTVDAAIKYMTEHTPMGQFTVLASGILIGILVYVALVTVMWLIMKKPNGAERMLIEKVMPALRDKLPSR